MSLINQAKKGVFWTFLQQFSVLGINFIVQIFLARLLLPSDFGLIAMITVFVAVGQSLSDSGMTSSLIRNKVNTEADYGTVFITNFVVSCFIFVMVYFFAPVVSSFYEQEILTDLLRSYSLIFIISSFYAVQIAKFSKELNFKSQFTYQLPSVIIGSIVAIIMAKNGFGVWSLIGLNITQAISFSIILWLFYKWRPKFIFDRTIFRGHFNYGYKLTISSLLTNLYLNLYKIIIGKLFTPATVGYFNQADGLRQFPVNQLSNVFNKVSFPLFASIQHDDEKLKNSYRIILNVVLSLSSSIMIISILIAEPLYLVVYGFKWLPAVPYFQILCLASIFLPVNIYNLNILKVKGRTDLYLKIDVIKKIIGVAALLSSLHFGIEGIVWSLCLTNIFFAYFNGFFSGQLISYSLREQFADTLRVISIAAIPGIINYILIQLYFNHFPNLLFIVVVVTLYMAGYIPLLFIFNKTFIKNVKKVLQSKNIA
ncbi:lipopolysaccharide biosynthesis protein [Arenibacter certesii]|uniref:Lipopolysaccharide biosynthesis protein n=1 Tax=Arenibacter certesii TaxID=228955 RepID=A0A918MHB4_9FLAO|nr:lipopolysaccharide biosynthesis protein [Arenibacter certesii]GGW22044.1 lipopolysaccharide biosynthesis protein [Arenibacter certesii]